MFCTNLNSATYHIDKLPSTSFSTNQYVYLSGFDGNIDIINEQWVFDFKLYLNGDFNVPTNTLYVDLNTPFTTQTKIPIVQKTITSPLPEYVKPATNANLYIFNLIVPTSESPYFDSKLINQKINVNLSFHVEPENLNKTDINEDIRSQFIKEFDGIKTSTNVSYTNFHSGNDQGCGNIIEKYTVTNDTFQVVDPKYFSWTLNEDCLDLTTPIKSLLDIELKGNFVVRGYQLDFVYSLEDKETKTLDYKFDNPVYCTDKYHLDFPFATAYDETKKEVVKSGGSDHSFYIPDNACGYYTVTVLLATSNNWITLKLTKAFNFITDPALETQLKVNQHFIRCIDNYKRMVIPNAK